MKKHIITETEYNAVKEASRKNKNKRIETLLKELEKQYELMVQSESKIKEPDICCEDIKNALNDLIDFL